MIRRQRAAGTETLRDDAQQSPVLSPRAVNWVRFSSEEFPPDEQLANVGNARLSAQSSRIRTGQDQSGVSKRSCERSALPADL